jgi:hypothetical protein
MRTGVLKDKAVSKTVNEKFVCAWKNIEGEVTCGGSYAHEVTDKPGVCMTGDGEHNTQICVFTPDGKLLDVMAGYQMPADLAAELEWAWKELRPLAALEKSSDEVKKGMLQRAIDSRLSKTKNFTTQMDQKYLREHVLDSWTQFSVEELVKGRGFGDHFFGRYGDKAMPGDGIGNVPGYTQNSLDTQKMNEISAEALRLKKQYNLAGEKLRREIKSKLVDLETEYEALKSKSRNASMGSGKPEMPVTKKD